MTIQQWQAYARQVRQRADRIQKMIDADMRRTGVAAGLGSQMPAALAHNAMCGLDYGQPWPELNYSLVRRVLWLRDRSFEPSRIADRIINRAFASVR